MIAPWGLGRRDSLYSRIPIRGAGFAIIWQGAALAAAVYSAQRFAVEHVLCSLRFWAIVFAMVLWGSVQICGVPVERFLATVVLVAGIFALALDVFPSKSNLKKYKIGRIRGGFSIKLRGKIPFIVYIVALAALLFLAWKQYGVCGGAESLSFDPAAESPLTDRQIKAYDEDFKEMTANRTMFGWGNRLSPPYSPFSKATTWGETLGIPQNPTSKDALLKTVMRGLLL